MGAATGWRCALTGTALSGSTLCLGPWPALVQAECSLCGTMPGRCGVDFQVLGAFIILQHSPSAQHFPGWFWSLRVSKLGCDGLNPGVRLMLRGLHPVCPTAGGEQCGVGGPWDQTCASSSPYSHPAPSVPQLQVASGQCHLSPHPLPGLMSLPWASVPYIPTSDCIFLHCMRFKSTPP